MTRKIYSLRLEGDTGETWAASALVQALSEQAKLCGFMDVEGVDIAVFVRVVGAVSETSVAELRARLRSLGVGAVRDVEVRELPNG